MSVRARKLPVGLWRGQPCAGVALNEWPYSIPVGAEHWVIWSRLSVFPATSTKLDMMRGLSGFSWRDPAQDTPAGREMGRFVRERWPAVDGWEAIWFANPPALRACLLLSSCAAYVAAESIQGVSHFHVLCRRRL
jgi:hypothetical protein